MTNGRSPASSRLARLGRLWRWIKAPPVAAPPLTRRQRALLVAGFALLVMVRLPLAWVHGRFQDEEGTIFFAYAWHHATADALWRPFAGYLNLGANAVTLAAARLVQGGVLSLGAAPYLTMATALAVQSLPALLLVTSGARWLGDRRAMVAALFLVAAAPLTEEVFVNTLHIQFHLALASALVLALDVPAMPAKRIAYALPLLVAPLCGPGAIVLLPLFVLRAGLDRSPARLAQALALGVGAVLQLALFFSRSPIRPDHLDPATVLAVLFVRLALLPLLTPPLATVLGRTVYASYRDGTVIWWGAVAGAIGYFGLLVRTAMRDRDDPAIWLIGAGLTIAAVSFGGGMIVSDPQEWFSVGSAERYDFLPLVLLGLGMIALATRPGGRHRRWRVIACVAMLVSGATGFVSPLKEFSGGPVWPAEVAAWRGDHRHRLATWPRDWTVDLSDGARACSPIAAPDAATDPSYCEGPWLARVRAAAERARPGPGRP